MWRQIVSPSTKFHFWIYVFIKCKAFLVCALGRCEHLALSLQSKWLNETQSGFRWPLVVSFPEIPFWVRRLSAGVIVCRPSVSFMTQPKACNPSQVLYSCCLWQIRLTHTECVTCDECEPIARYILYEIRRIGSDRHRWFSQRIAPQMDYNA